MGYDRIEEWNFGRKREIWDLKWNVRGRVEIEEKEDI